MYHKVSRLLLVTVKKGLSYKFNYIADFYLAIYISSQVLCVKYYTNEV